MLGAVSENAKIRESTDLIIFIIITPLFLKIVSRETEW
jgi:hypothetical protein